MKRLFAFAVAMFALLPLADARDVVDLAGRHVTVPDRVARVVLGEGRMLIALGILRPENPLEGVVGMMGEYPLLDPAGFALWQKQFPAVDGIPLVGKASGDTLNAEAAIALKPDLAIFGLAGHGPSPKAEALVERLEAAGVAVIFVDFFHDPLNDTTKSVRLLGEVLGHADRADAFAKAYDAALAAVDARVAKTSARPLVFLENRVGLGADCCATVGNAVIGNLVERAGGRNLGTGLIGLEYLLSHQPDIYVGTAIGNPLTRASQPARIQAGPGVSPEDAQASLRNSLARTGIAQLDAVRDGRAYAIWHHFFHSPFNVVAVQAMAKWFHPQEFADVDPEATWRDFMTRFQPFVSEGAYWTGTR